MKFENVRILKLGEPDRNGRIYNKFCFQEALENPEAIYFGKVGEQRIPELKTSEITHYFNNIRIEDDYLVGDIIIDEHKYPLLAEKVKEGKVSFGVNGYGEMLKGNKMANFDLHSISIGY